MKYHKNGKIGRKFGDGIQWYPNLFSAIVNRSLQRRHQNILDIDLLDIMMYAKKVQARYERWFEHRILSDEELQGYYESHEIGCLCQYCIEYLNRLSGKHVSIHYEE